MPSPPFGDPTSCECQNPSVGVTMTEQIPLWALLKPQVKQVEPSTMAASTPLLLLPMYKPPRVAQNTGFRWGSAVDCLQVVVGEGALGEKDQPRAGHVDAMQKSIVAVLT